MKGCKHVRQRFVQALYGELDPPRQAEFDDHLQACPDCRSDYGELRATLDIMDLRRRPQPEPAYWAEFSRKVEQRVRQSESSRPAAKIFGFGRRTPAAVPATRTLPHWAWRTAAALALLALGALIGRLSWTPPATQTGPGPESPARLAESAAVEQRAVRYMERSRALLLGIVNIDTSDEGAEVLDLQPHKRASRRLIEETPSLKQELARSDDEQLLELVSELEMILLQIANLEARQDLESVEVIRDGVRQRGLLMRIQLEKGEFRAKPQRRQGEEHKVKKDKT